MGLDLRLLPLDHLSITMNIGGKSTCFGFSHTILNVPRNGSGAIDAIYKLWLKDSTEELPDGHEVAAHLGGRVDAGKYEGEQTYGTLDTDAYGERYTWVSAGTLAAVLTKYNPKHPTTAYIAALHPDNLVILDWH